MADVMFRTGDWDGAVDAAERGLRRSLDRGAGLGDVWMRCVLGHIHLHRAELDLAAEETAAAERLVEGGATGIERVSFLRALLSEASGDVRGALAVLRALWTELEHRGINLKLLEIASDSARIARRCDDRSFAATIVETIRQLANRCPDSVAPAVLARCRGLAERNPDLLARAATMLGQRRRPLEEAFAQWEAASLLDERGAPGRALPLRAAAAVLLEPSGATPRPIEVVGGTPQTELPTSWCSLTPAERTVVDLVADGLSNADIATRLICSRRTVESHLHHVYTKLGISSRVALAVEARRQCSAA
jgi:DNA-binding CsgD family transcriptional regulator